MDEKTAKGSAAEEWFTSGDLARATGTTLRTVRFYEGLGLVHPGEATRGRRRYGAQAMAEMHRVVLLLEAGLTLKEVGEVLRQVAEEPTAGRRRQKACKLALTRMAERLRSRAKRIEQRLAAVQRARDTDLTCAMCFRQDCEGCRTLEKWMRLGG